MRKYFHHIIIFLFFIALLIPISHVDAQVVKTMTNALKGAIVSSFTSLLTMIFYVVLTIAAYILGLAGMILDYVLKFTILDMRENIASLNGINIAWKLIKDLMNIVFIFMLLYQGIKVIIGQESTQSVKTFIIGIVLSAILINFSLFFTKILIDASNVISIGFYQQITSGRVTINYGGPIPSTTISGISAPFVDVMKITKFWEPGGIDKIKNAQGSDWNAVILPMLGIVIFAVLAFVFLAMAAVFAVRFVTLLILLMLSPVAYMGLALSGMKGYATQWWNALISQLMFAPLFMIMIWVILQLMGSQGFLVPQGASWSNLVPGGTQGSGIPISSIGLIFNFFIAIGLIFAALFISKSTSTKGSAYIGQMTGMATKATGAAAFGLTAWGGRRTIGRIGNNIANNEDLKDRAAKGGIGGFAARMQLSAANKAANSTFDARATKSFNYVSETGGMKGAFGKVDPKKDNIKAQLEAKAKEQEEMLKKYKPSDLAAKSAENKLDSAEFKSAENKRLEDYLKSDKFKNDNKELNEKLEKVEIEEKQIQDLAENEKKDLARIKQLEEQKIFLSEQDELNKKAEIEALKKKVENDKATAEKLKNNNSERESVRKELEAVKKTWMSKEKEELIALKGGQKEEKDKSGNVTQRQVLSSYQTRANNIANRYEEGGVMTRFADKISKGTGTALRYIPVVVGGGVGAVVGSTAGVGGVYAGAIAGATAGNTVGSRMSSYGNVRKSERSEIARRIKKQAGGKESVDEKLKKILKEEGEIKEKEPEPEVEKPAEAEKPKE